MNIDSKVLFAMVSAMLCVVCVGVVTVDDDVEAVDSDLTATGGSGTATDPYYGTLTGTLEYGNFSSNIFIMVGTEININGGEKAESPKTIWNLSEFGLNNEESYDEIITGTVTKTGVTVIGNGSGGSVYGMPNAGVIFVDGPVEIPNDGVYFKSRIQDNPYLALIVLNYANSPSDGSVVEIYQGSPIYYYGATAVSGDTTGLTGDSDIEGTLNGTDPLVIETLLGTSFTIQPVPRNDESEIDYTAPDAIEAISGSTVHYTASANIEDTTFSFSDTEWMISPTTTGGGGFAMHDAHRDIEDRGDLHGHRDLAGRTGSDHYNNCDDLAGAGLLVVSDSGSDII